MTLTNTLTRLVSFMVALLVSGISFAQSDNTEKLQGQIRLKPAKCVSLHQGQVCYADVELVWQTNSTGNYCLFSNTQEQPLSCWHNSSRATFAGEISSNTNVVFTLTKQGSTQSLATAEMKMAWVYKKKRSSVSWRVF